MARPMPWVDPVTTTTRPFTQRPLPFDNWKFLASIDGAAQCFRG
jgi:hypothetical protein